MSMRQIATDCARLRLLGDRIGDTNERVPWAMRRLIGSRIRLPWPSLVLGPGLDSTPPADRSRSPEARR